MGSELDYSKLSALESFPYFSKSLLSKEALNRPVFENGTNLSGSDLQKLSLIRFFLKDNDVVVLDEITNAMDYEAKISLLT